MEINFFQLEKPGYLKESSPEVFDKFLVRIITNSEKSVKDVGMFSLPVKAPYPLKWISSSDSIIDTRSSGPVMGKWTLGRNTNKEQNIIHHPIAEKWTCICTCLKRFAKSKDENINNWINGIRELLEEPDSNAILLPWKD